MNAMLEIAKRFNDLLIDRLAISGEMGAFLYSVVMIAAMIAIGIGVYWIFLSIFRGFMHHSTKLKNSGWQSRLLKRNLSRNILLIIPGIVLYFIPHLIYVKGDSMIRLLHRGDLIYILIVLIMIMNSILLTFLDYYSTTDKNRKHPLKGIIQGIQVVLVFIGSIIIIAILLDKSPTVLLTGLGASAAVLMLVFKDSILGFVAGVQLSQNNAESVEALFVPDNARRIAIWQISKLLDRFYHPTIRYPCMPPTDPQSFPHQTCFR